MSSFIDVGALKKKLYDRQRIEFNYFRDINDKSIQKIDNKIDDFYQKFPNRIFIFAVNPIGEMYKYALSFIVEERSLSYDEKILFLIKLLDPDLKMHELYLSKTNISQSEIDEEEADIVKDELKKRQIQQQFNITAFIRSEIGIYDPKLLFYEKCYKAKCIEDQELVFDVKKDYIENLFAVFMKVENSLEMTELDLARLMKEAKKYIQKYGTPSLNDLAYQLTVQAKVLGISNLREKIVFIIYVLDSSFKAFEIYDNASNWKDIKSNCIDEIGFYEKNFVLAEVIYDNTINKEKSLSVWK